MLEQEFDEQDEEEEEDSNNQIPLKPAEEPPEEWAPWSLVLPTKNSHAPPPVAVKTTPGPAWDIGQVLKAARLLYKPPMPVEFLDEQEMRCVYSLIYEVFRYKTILEQTIDDTEFLHRHPQYIEHRHSLWLFLMELARRRWGARARGEVERAERLLDAAGSPFKDLENVIWDERVHFAAAIARIRIKNKAFTLSELLPPHLREERVLAGVNKDTVTGWVNTFKAKKVALLVKRLHELGFTYSNSRQLCAGEYRFDRVCPRFITLRPPEHSTIGQLELVKEGIIVLQEREFCEGASTLCRAIRASALRGVVAQSHASSPRCSAYLAAQLRDLAAVLKASTPAAPVTPELGKLVVFGAGDKVESYVCALRELGIEASQAPQSGAPVLILSDPVHCETPTVMSALNGVVAVLATPPNSYSAVTDPIDLVCGRGGDIAMLEVLTESEMDLKGKARVKFILEEQKKTLRTLMSKPQIQLILYETHSALEAENQAQITRAVAEANRLARERHMFLKRRHRTASPKKQVVSTPGTDTILSETSILSSVTMSRADTEDQLDEVSISESQSPEIASKPPSRPPSSRPMSSRPTTRPGTASTRPGTARSKPSTEIVKKHTENVNNQSRSGKTKARPIPAMPENDFPHNPDKDNPNVFVPNCDLFEIMTLPNLGNGLDINYILDRDGCFLGLIQRKEITRLNAKYMIQVAEDRGLFGAAAAPPPPTRRKQTSPRRRKRKASFEVERIAAPTYASLTRSRRRGSAPACLPSERRPSDAAMACERHAKQQAAAAVIAAATCTCDARHRVDSPTYASLTDSKCRGSAPACFSPSRGPFRQLDVVAVKPAHDMRDRYRVKSTNGSLVHGAPGLELPCRRPFPLVVQELHLKSLTPPQKVGV